MTPERWRQIDELFDAAVRLDPAEREAWLRQACGDDDDLRAEVDRLLAQDERADRDGFLRRPRRRTPPAGSDGELAPPRRGRPRRGPAPIDPAGVASRTTTRRLSRPRRRSPRARRPHPISEAPAVVRARLRELPMIYILILAIATFWRRVVLRQDDPTLYYRRRGRDRPGPRWASSPCSGAGGPSRWPGSRPWSWA